jgi:hypothetical protein
MRRLVLGMYGVDACVGMDASRSDGSRCRSVVRE